MQRTVIGLVGEASSGKGEVASFLQNKGFSCYSLSNLLRDIAASLELSHERGSLVKIGTTLRERFGNDILARGIMRSIETEESNSIVIDSIRNPGELIFLRQNSGAYIIGLTMSPERRYQLMMEKNRPGDPKNWGEFLGLLNREQGVGQTENGIQVQRCLELADTIIVNDGTLKDLHEKTTETLLAKGIILEGFSPYKERF